MPDADAGAAAPADGDAARLARRSAAAMWAADAASPALGITLGEVGPGRAEARMRVGAHMVNGHGIAHGGYLFLLADTALAFASNSHGTRTVSRSAEIVFVRPAHAGDELVAGAVERARAGRSGLYDVTVRRGEEVVAELRGQVVEVGGRVDDPGPRQGSTSPSRRR